MSGGDFWGGLTVTTTQACGKDGNLCLARLGRPKRAVFETEVLGTIEDGGGLGGEGNGGHFEAWK
jgi:hypothetical protein